MFGGDLLPAVTVGMALGLDNGAIQSHADPVRTIDAPAPALRSGGSGHDGCCIRIVGGGTNHPQKNPDGSWKRDERDITDEPSTTIPAFAGAMVGGPLLRVHEYRWSDAMLEKHPPASPASPAPTVQAKWYKGGAEGLIAIRKPRCFTGSGGCIRRDHPISEPSPAVDGRHGGSGLHGVLAVKSTLESPSPTVSGGGTATGGAEPIPHMRREGFVRRLTPDECARLQSLPDDFIWPESVKKTHRYRIIGNGWASLMAMHMGKALKAADPKSRTVIDLFCGGGCGAVGWHGRAWKFVAA